VAVEGAARSLNVLDCGSHSISTPGAPFVGRVVGILSVSLIRFRCLLLTAAVSSWIGDGMRLIPRQPKTRPAGKQFGCLMLHFAKSQNVSAMIRSRAAPSTA